jgi:hypothetical protein
VPNRGQKCSFSEFRPVPLIEAYGTEKGFLMYVGLLVAAIFLDDILQAAAY